MPISLKIELSLQLLKVPLTPTSSKSAKGSPVEPEHDRRGTWSLRQANLEKTEKHKLMRLRTK
jgi:hypothetical protein